MSVFLYFSSSKVQNMIFGNKVIAYLLKSVLAKLKTGLANSIPTTLVNIKNSNTFCAICMPEFHSEVFPLTC